MWDLIPFIQGKARRSCLIELASGPKTPGALAKATGYHLPHISRALKVLEEKGIVECKTPKASKNRFYEITDGGINLLAKLKEIDPEGIT